MKLLLDENLSRRLVPALQAVFPGSSQVALLGLEQASDEQIWRFAKDQCYALVSKDDDFRDMQVSWGFPPKLVLLAMGNCTNQAVLQALIRSATDIRNALAHADIGLIEIF